MKLIKTRIFLLLLLFLSPMLFTPAAFSADKPVWTIEYGKFNLPKHGKPVSQKNWETMGSHDKPNPNYKIQFTPNNKILVSFLEHKYQPESGSKAPPEKFVVLLLSSEKGELIRRVEWPVTGDWVEQVRYVSRIYPLPSGGYVGLINRRLQVFDSSFNVIHDRVLDILENVNEKYNIITPLSGKFFILIEGSAEIKIIDSVTFETVEQLTGTPDLVIVDIWGDRLLSNSFNRETRERRFFEKKIGAPLWNAVGLFQGGSANAKYVYNGAIVFTGIIEYPPDRKTFWFMVEAGKKSDPVFEWLGPLKSSWNTLVVARKNSKTSEIRRVLDLFGVYWVEAYDLSTGQVLLTTKKYTQDPSFFNTGSGEEILDYAISPDGVSIVNMTTGKIELYTVVNSHFK